MKMKAAGMKMNTHGGRRPGSGRKPGSGNKTARSIAETALLEGITPLEVLLKAMRLAWEKATNGGETIVDMKEALFATWIAERAAPYAHPRLVASKHEVTGEGGEPLIQGTVHIWLPDNGRDPDVVRLTPERPPLLPTTPNKFD